MQLEAVKGWGYRDFLGVFLLAFLLRTEPGRVALLCKFVQGFSRVVYAVCDTSWC